MTLIKYIFAIIVCAFGFQYSYGQCTVPSSNPNKFEVLHADNQVTDEQTQSKILTGRVVFQVSDFILKADSAIVNSENDRFEAFGNVTLIKNGENLERGLKAVYSNELQIINLDKAIFQVGAIKQDALKPAEIVYKVSR